MWSGRELNPRHEDFQSSALPTELPDRLVGIANITNRREKRIWLSLLAARCSYHGVHAKFTMGTRTPLGKRPRPKS